MDDHARSLIVELRVPADDFVLAQSMANVPKMVLELERYIPVTSDPMPFVWATGGGYREFGEALAADPDVADLRLMDDLDGGGLFRIEWNGVEETLTGAFSDGDEAILQAHGQGDEWFVKLRFPTRESLGDFQDHCAERDVDFTLLKLYDTQAPKLGQYDLTMAQREALVTGLEMGYFAVPRQAELSDIADALDLSANAVSERIRRGEANLFRSALTIQRPPQILDTD